MDTTLNKKRITSIAIIVIVLLMLVVGVVVVLNNNKKTIEQPTQQTGTTYLINKPGTYEVDSSYKEIIISVSGVTVTSQTIDSVLLTSTIKDGEVTLNGNFTTLAIESSYTTINLVDSLLDDLKMIGKENTLLVNNKSTIKSAHLLSKATNTKMVVDGKVATLKVEAQGTTTQVNNEVGFFDLVEGAGSTELSCTTDASMLSMFTTIPVTFSGSCTLNEVTTNLESNLKGLFTAKKVTLLTPPSTPETPDKPLVSVIKPYQPPSKPAPKPSKPAQPISKPATPSKPAPEPGTPNVDLPATDKEKDTDKPTQDIVVTSLVVSGTNNATTITTKDGTLQLLVAVSPTDATNKEVIWSLDNSNVASISKSGLLTALSNGTVTAQATSVSAPSISGSLTIKISNQLVPNSESDFVFNDKYQIITQYKGTRKDVVIPEKINGLAVKNIGYQAFYNKGLTSVIIPEFVERIGDSSFSENLLTTIELPDSLTTIVRSAFNDNKLTSITLGKNIKEIGSRAFEDNQLTELVIPDSVATIGINAFSNNTLKRLAIGSGLQEIEDDVFRDNELTSLIIPDTIISIKRCAFSNNELTSLTLGKNVEKIGSNAFKENQITSLIIPNSVTTIGQEAFRNNKLTSFFIPNSLTSLQLNAFMENGNNQNSLGLPVLTSKNYVGTWELKGDSKSWTIVETPTEYFTFDEDSKTIIAYSGDDKDVVIPKKFGESEVKAIGNNVFKDKALTSINIPNSAETIGEYAFENNNLTSVTLPDSLTTIEKSAFENNTQLVVINFNYKLTSIGWGAFKNNAITSLKLPDSLITISAHVFDNPYESPSITSVTFGNKITTIGVNAFRNNLITTLVLPDSVTTLGETAFHRNKLTSLTIGKGVTSLEYGTFLDNELTSLTLGENTKIIGRSSFSKNKLETVVIPDSVTHINNSAFLDNNLASLTLGKGLQEIEDYVFKNNRLISLTIPNGVKSIGYEAFYNNNLTSVTLPESLETLGTLAFFKNGEKKEVTKQMTKPYMGTWELKGDSKSWTIFESPFKFDPGSKTITGYTGSSKDIIIPSQIDFIDVEKIGDFAFSDPKHGGSMLTSVELPVTLIEIGIAAFHGNNLTSIVIPNSVKTIGRSAFHSNNIKTVSFSRSLESIGYGAFFNNELVEVDIPSSVTSIGSEAFQYNKLNLVTINGNPSTIENDAFLYNGPNKDSESQINRSGIWTLKGKNWRITDAVEYLNQTETPYIAFNYDIKTNYHYMYYLILSPGANAPSKENILGNPTYSGSYMGGKRIDIKSKTIQSFSNLEADKHYDFYFMFSYYNPSYVTIENASEILSYKNVTPLLK